MPSAPARSAPTAAPPQTPGLTTRARSLRLLGLVLLILCALGFLIWHKHLSFDLLGTAHQLRHLSPLHIGLGLLFIYTAFCLRALRWSILLRPVKRVPWTALLPTQLIGFTAVAFFGRVADLSRPYLTARQLNTPVPTQLAVYSIERTFDLAAAAILFSVTLAFAPPGLPHHAAFARAGLLSLLATSILGAFAVTLRLAGNRVVAGLTASIARLSPSLAATAQKRLQEFQRGFTTVTSTSQFLAALLLSLAMWLAIALTYLQAAHAFSTSPQLAHSTFTGTMLLLATSLGASVLQLPVLGWFTQMAVIAGAYHAFFAVPLDVASACGALTLLLTTLSVIPAGLIASRRKNLRLRDLAGSETSDDRIENA